MKKIEKILVHTYTYAYNDALKKHEVCENKRNRLFDIAKSFGLHIPEETVDFVTEIYVAVDKKYRTKNILGVVPERLAELVGINLNEYLITAKEFSKMPKWPKPSIEKYQVWAETPEEIKRLKLAQDLKNTIAAASDYMSDTYVPDKCGPILLNGHNKGAIINPDFVLNGIKIR